MRGVFGAVVLPGMVSVVDEVPRWRCRSNAERPRKFRRQERVKGKQETERGESDTLLIVCLVSGSAQAPGEEIGKSTSEVLADKGLGLHNDVTCDYLWCRV